MNYQSYIPHCIFISTTLIFLYSSDLYLHLNISNHELLSNASNILASLLSKSPHMKTYESYDYEEDDANVIEYTESSVEAYFNAYWRLEQKYTMRPRYGIARAVYERTLRDEAIESFDKATVSHLCITYFKYSSCVQGLYYYYY